LLNLVPKKVFFTKGVGVHKFRISSFEEALRVAGVANQNLVSVSSILPPRCEVISQEEGLTFMTPGSIRFSVIARSDTNENGRFAAASVGLAVPKDTNKWGYLSEVHDHGLTSDEAGDMAEDIAASMLATTLGINLDPDSAWSEKEQVYKTSGLIVHTSNTTQTAKGVAGKWTTVLAMAVFIV